MVRPFPLIFVLFYYVLLSDPNQLLNAIKLKTREAGYDEAEVRGTYKYLKSAKIGTNSPSLYVSWANFEMKIGDFFFSFFLSIFWLTKPFKKEQGFNSIIQNTL